MHRRTLLQSAVAVGGATLVATQADASEQSPKSQSHWIDTHVHLSQWPFRRLPLDRTDALVDRLRELGIGSAWAGSYDSLLHRDISSVNRRLADECARHAELTAIGTIDPTLPGWEGDLQQCVERWKMPGIRVYPGYHGYRLDDSRFDAMLARAARQGVFVQVVVALEDERTQHPTVRVPDVDLQPVADMMRKHVELKVQLLGKRWRVNQLTELSAVERLYFDSARLDQTDALAEVMAGAAAERMLFGSHSPFLIPDAAVIRVGEYPMAESAVRKLTRENAGKFLTDDRTSPQSSKLHSVDGR